MAQRNLIAYVLKGGGGVRSWVAALTALALTAGALFALAPAAAQEPVGVPPGLEFQLQLVDDSDNIVQADSTISVSGRLRLELGTNLLSVAEGALQLSGAHDWEASHRSRLSLGVENLLPALEQSGEITAYEVQPVAGVPLSDNEMLRVLAWDGDTVIGRSGPGNPGGGDDNTIYIFSASTGEQVGGIQNHRWHSNGNSCAIWLPGPSSSCVIDANQGWSWGRANDDNTGSTVAVWHEDADTAWLFVSMNRLTYRSAGTGVWWDGYQFQDVGTMHIYEIDYSTDPATISHRRRINMPSTLDYVFSKATFTIAGGASAMAHYGSSVAISADGSTLAVGARRMHDVGAVYVYTRPAGGWGASLGWNDGVRVSPVVIPAWGGHPTDQGGPANQANRRPFEPQSTTDGDGATECDAYCRSVSSYVGDVDHLSTVAHADFGYYVALSADGSVLAVSAPSKRFASDRTAGPGRFRGGNSLPRQGELLVFLEPSGGWSSVPNYKTGRTELGWDDDASSFSQSSHHNVGPDKRVHGADWTFSFDWNDAQNHYLGERLALSQDGTTLAASDRHNNAVQIFQVDSPSGWAAGPSTPRATLTGVEDGGRWGGFGFNVDGDRLALGDPTYSSPAGVSNQGRLLLFRRPADGSWADAAAADADELLPPTEPTDRRVNNERYGRSLAWNLHDRAGLAVGAGESTNVVGGGAAVGPGRLWTLAILPGCDGEEARSVVDGVTYCHLDLSLGGDSSIVIPAGTPDGAFTISGNVSIEYGEDAEGEPLSVQRRATLEVQIGDVVEVAEVRLERATDDRGTADTADDALFPDTLAEGETTTLRLQVLNEHGKAAATDSVSLVSVTSSAGELSAEITGSTSTCRGGGGTLSCIIDGSALTAANADKIMITLRHAGKPGAAQVSARAISKQGEQAATEQPLTIALTGAPATLSISEPTTGVLGYDTPDAGADVDARDVDNRDVLTLTVTAADKDGAAVTVPSISTHLVSVVADEIGQPTAYRWWHTGAGETFINWLAVSGARTQSIDVAGLVGGQYNRNPRVRVTGPDGQSAPISWYMTTDAAQDNVAVVLDVDTDPSAPLANGEYTVQVRAGGLTGERTFTVVGGAASVELSEPSPAPAIQGEFTVVATVVDAQGTAAPNGTPVHWAERTIGDETTMLVRTGGQTITTDGKAEASYLVVSAGTAVITVTADGTRTGAGGVSGGVSNVIRIAVADPAAAVAAQPPSIIEQLSSTTPGAPTSWLGESSVTASALLNALQGVDSILLWQYGRWLSYAVVDGREIPGSYDFVAQPGAVLWLVE